MFKILLASLAGYIIFYSASSMAADNYCNFVINSNNLTDYNKLLDGRDPNSINKVKNPNFSRHLKELLVFQKAAHLGKCDCEVKYVRGNVDATHKRAIADVVAGRNVAHPIAGFSNDPRYKRDISLSHPILSKEDFYVGLYTHSDRGDILEIDAMDKMRDLTFTAGESWDIDIAVLNEKGFKKNLADSWVSALKLIQAGRADIIMQPFSARKDFSFTDGNLNETFRPIPNVKMRFGAGRRYFVSQKHPQGKKFLACLNAGIKTLEESGFLAQANIDSGVVNPRVADWAVLD